MTFDEHVQRVVTRARSFYQMTTPGHFLVHVRIPAEAPPLPPLDSFDLDTQYPAWLDCWLEAARPGWAAKAGIDDDGIPSLCPWFGIAEHSAWLGADVRLQADTSLPTPMLHSLDAIDHLALSAETTWFRLMKKSYDYLRSKQDGTFLLSVRGAMMPMDIANAVRGDELFTDFLLHPEAVHRLLQWMVGAIHWYYDHLQSWADEIDGGYCFFHSSGGWMPAGTLGHVANDAAMLCSSKVYAEFGFPYEQQLAERYKAVMYHVHNQKMHFVPQLVQLPGLALLEVTHDPQTLHPIEDLSAILPKTGQANLLLRVASDQVRKHLAELQERNVFFDVTCEDHADAEDVVSLVRAHSHSLR